MFRYILKRLVSSVLVLVIIVTASFFIMRVAPGGPFDTERSMPEEVLQNIQAKYNLDKPLWQQYLLQMKSIMLEGDFGPSMKYPNKSVNDILAEGLPVSMTLGVQSLVVALLIGLPAGLIAALKQNQWADYTAMTGAMVGISIPNFVLGPILIALFAIELPWFAAAGWNSLSAGLVPYLQTSVLPSLALGSAYAAYVARLTRGGMLEITRQDYIQTARAKGLREWLIVRRHALRGALIPVVSYLGPAFAGMLTGSIVIEQIFNIPGLGSHFVNSAFNRDYPLVLGTIVLYSGLLVVLNLVVDIAYTVLDPRVSYEDA
ncbi:MAG: ABC transporter permease subunit [Bacteroidetes bacterium]|jgi:oligopeptide transport system permease protein|nr:ABC transporter permease subunit [Bacteroidota bacterium]